MLEGQGGIEIGHICTKGRPLFVESVYLGGIRVQRGMTENKNDVKVK